MTTASDTLLTQYIDPDTLSKDIAIDQLDLSTGLAQHASKYVYYAMQAVRARRQYERYKATFEVLEAQLDGEYRKAALDEGKKTTETGIKSAIALDVRWRNGSSKVIDAQQEWKMAEVGERAFEQRKDMLLQLARDAARESEGQLRVSAVSSGRDRFLEAAAAQKLAAA